MTPSPWVRVEDRLPDPETDVLVFSHGDAYGDFQVAGYTHETDEHGTTRVRWIGCPGEDVFNVTHWMDIPEPEALYKDAATRGVPK